MAYRLSQVLLCACLYRGGTCDDICYKPGYGHVLGHVTLECHGDHGTVCLLSIH